MVKVDTTGHILLACEPMNNSFLRDALGVKFSIFSLFAPRWARQESRKRSPRVCICMLYFLTSPFPLILRRLNKAPTNCCAPRRTSRIHPLPNFPHVSLSAGPLFSTCPFPSHKFDVLRAVF